jgi:chromosome segregation ATPase
MQIREPKPQMPGTGVPHRWEVDHGVLQINFLANTFFTQMAKHNDILESYRNSLQQEKMRSRYLESIIHDFQNKVQDAQGEIQALQADYQRLATHFNQSTTTVCTYSPT